MSASNSLSARISAYPSQARSLGNLSKHAGAYKRLIRLTLPPQLSPDCIHTLVHQARAQLAINNASAASSVLPTDLEDVVVKAVSVLASYIAGATPFSSESSEVVKATWRELRNASDRGSGW